MTLTAPGPPRPTRRPAGPSPRSRPRPRLPRLRRHLPAGRRARLRRVLRPARGRLRPRADAGGHPRADRGRARRTSGATPRCCPPARTRPSRVTLDPGMTPLVRADRAGRGARHHRRGCGSRTTRPTRRTRSRTAWSPWPLTAAKGLGFTRFACASTGNLANSVAAHAARAGLPVDRLHPGRPGAGQGRADRGLRRRRWSPIEGSYDDVNRLCSELAETDEFEDTAFVNVNVRPFYAEGSKTLGYEVAEQLGWRIPAQVVIPMAIGLAAHQGRQGVRRAGRRSGSSRRTEWKVFGAQSAGCNPIATAFDNGWDVDQAGQADRHRQVAQHRQPGRRPVRAGRRPPHRRLDGLRRRRRDPRRASAARPHHRRLRRDRRRRDRRGAAEAGRRPASSTRTQRPSSSTPARA